MEYLYKLVNLLNQYDGNDRKVENEIRDLICFISDDPNYMDNELYRNIIFEASQKLRVFGYIKGTNKISQEEFYYDDLNDIKHLAVQKYYQSKVFRNNLLDKRQKDVVDCFMSLKKKRIIVSAPTSFGKTFLLREIIYLNKDTYHNILLLFPTIALLNENTESMNKLIQTLGLEYIIINNVYSKIDTNKKYIFILTPERALKLLADNEDLNIDFFFFDEVYKIDEDFDCNEDDGEEIGLKENGNRAKAFRIVLYLLAKSVKDYYLAGPYLNLANVKYGMERFVKENGVTKIQVDFEPTTHIEVDAWKKNIIEHHPVTGEKQNALYDHSQLKTKEKVQGIIKYLKNNNLGQAIFYCSTPSKAIEYTKDILDISLSCDKEIMHGKKPIETYNKERSRFFSEYGFQSFPEFESVKRYAPCEEDWDIYSEVMMSHQRGGMHANQLIETYLLNEYRKPKNFEAFLYMNHVLQGDAIKTAIEAHRRDMPYCMGTLFWQHNDCWPVASWASRDYYGRWKAQHYFARKAYRDILVSPITDEDGVLNIQVVSDRLKSCNGTLQVEVMKLTGEKVNSYKRNIKIDANSSQTVFSVPLGEALKNTPKEDVFVHAVLLTDKGKNSYANNYFLVKQKEVNYPKAAITSSIEPIEGGFELTLNSDNFARAVFITIGDVDSSFSDNYFDILPGGSVKVNVYTDLPQPAFKKQLKVISLSDEY